MQLRMLWVHVHLLQVVKTRMSRILHSSGAVLIIMDKTTYQGSYTMRQETKGHTAYCCSWGL